MIKLKNISIDFEINAIKTWVPKMKEDGADVIIVLTSSGVPWDREEVYSDFITNEEKNLQGFKDYLFK